MISALGLSSKYAIMSLTASSQDTLKASYAYGTSPLPPTSRKDELETFLFGYPIAHSMAPMVHATLFKGLSIPWTYKLFETEEKSLFLPALKKSNIIGCAITMPHKVTLASAVDTVTEEGRMIGAINTVFLRKGADGTTKYIGTNTDCVGVREAFLQNFPHILQESKGKPAVIIGGGGACRSAVYALSKWLGATKIYMVNRLQSEVIAIIESFKAARFEGELLWVGSVEQAKDLEAPVLIVGSVPDFKPKEEGEMIARDITNVFLNKKKKGYVLEMCYHPNPVTAFCSLAEKAGWKVLPGTECMIYQGVAQQVLWTELPLEKFELEEVHAKVKHALESH